VWYVVVERSTVYRWGQRFLPLFQGVTRTHRQQVGGKWRVDETYCRLNGKWAYLQDGQVVNVYFSERRNAGAAKSFLKRATAI
jgi:transposase-like protein